MGIIKKNKKKQHFFIVAIGNSFEYNMNMMETSAYMATIKNNMFFADYLSL